MAQSNDTDRADKKLSGSAADPGGPGASGNEENEEIIELSDIAIGTSAEDEAIIELTEDLVDEAMKGISGATWVVDSDETELELSKAPESEIQPITPETESKLISESDDLDIPDGESFSAIEAEISRELDNYFQLDEEPVKIVDTPEAAELAETDEGGVESAATVTQEQFEAALEKVIEKLFGQKIERILNEVIERKVAEDVEGLKEFLLKRRQDD